MKDVVGSYWHGEDIESAVSSLNEDFCPFGAAAVTEQQVQAAFARLGVLDDEEALRRHQIGWMARRANAALAVAGRDDRVRAFKLDDRTDESGWYLVTPAEYPTVLAQRGAPEDIERAWDDTSITDPVAEFVD